MRTAMELRRWGGDLRGVIVLASMLLLASCGGDAEPGGGSNFEAYTPINIGGSGEGFFERWRLYDVDINMDEADLQTLKGEGRSLASAARDCIPEYEYTRFSSTVTISARNLDGEEVAEPVTMDKVNIRKKGFIGSLSITRPSVILYFDDLVPGRTYKQRDRMTLNNNRQDASKARTCMSFWLFEKAGLPTPQCNFARVTINGEDMGIFSHVEPMRMPFLQSAFGPGEGNLYESQTADFGTYLSPRFEKKNFRRQGRSDLEAIDAVIELEDDQAMLDILSQQVDIEQFIEFWAMEVLLGLWDGATGNANNFSIYAPPSDGRFRFLPWGPDTGFSLNHQLSPGTGVIYRNFSLANRFYEIPELRAQFESTLGDYLDNVWDEDELLDQLANIRQLTGVDIDAQSHVLDFIDVQRDRIEDELELATASGSVSLLNNVPPNCGTPVKTTVIGELSAGPEGESGTVEFVRDGNEIAAQLQGAIFGGTVSGFDGEMSEPRVEALTLLFSGDDGSFYGLQFFIEAPQFTDGSFGLMGFSNNVILIEINPATFNFSLLALGDTGTITLSGVDDYLADSGNLAVDLDLVLEYGQGVQ